jgi:hypothetical protein
LCRPFDQFVVVGLRATEAPFDETARSAVLLVGGESAPRAARAVNQKQATSAWPVAKRMTVLGAFIVAVFSGGNKSCQVLHPDHSLSINPATLQKLREAFVISRAKDDANTHSAKLKAWA